MPETSEIFRPEPAGRDTVAAFSAPPVQGQQMGQQDRDPILRLIEDLQALH